MTRFSTAYTFRRTSTQSPIRWLDSPTAAKGWGIKDDTFNALDLLGRLGDDTWFRLGDKDLATHITRTRFLNEGFRLSQATDRIRRALGIKATILPMADERVETRVRDAAGRNFLSGIFRQGTLVERSDGDSLRSVSNRAGPRRACLRRLSARQRSSLLRAIRSPVSDRSSLVPGIRSALMREAARRRSASVRSSAQTRFPVRRIN